MGSHMIRYLLTFLLVAGLFGISGEFGHAEPNPQSGQTQRYFPWVPYGEVISDSRGFPDSGPYYGLITVQNLESEQIKINAYPVGAGTITPLPADFILGPGESRSYLPGSIFGEAAPLSSGILV
ncbi:MAG: hypothetical protein EA415_01070, partial [Sphaerobacteraceae bacterium]